MKKLKVITIGIFLISFNFYAQDSNIGLGVMLGEPSGINGKYWVSEQNAFVAGIGGHFFGPNDGFSFHIDYIYHIDNSFNTNISFPLYYGFGTQLRSEGNKFGLGFRGVGGILFYPDKLPIDIFAEFVPVFKLLPKTKLNLDVAIGARYYFD